MARLVRHTLWQLPLLHHHCCSAAFYLFPSPTSIPRSKTTSHVPHLWSLPFLRRRSFHRRSRGGLDPRNALSPSDLDQESSSTDSESEVKKSRNRKKREARRAVRWGMELASFSTPQIKRILKVASLEREVLEALMLVKRLSSDVREGKRRQYNYIGKLLREVDPELMDTLILATRDGDWSRLKAISGLETDNIANDIDAGEEFEESDEEDDEGSEVYIDIATRWFGGLISKDIEVTNEVYAVHGVDFDRQELRKLVREVHAVQERKATEENEEEVDTALSTAQKSLGRFLRALARQISSEPNYVDV